MNSPVGRRRMAPGLRVLAPRDDPPEVANNHQAVRHKGRRAAPMLKLNGQSPLRSPRPSQPARARGRAGGTPTASRLHKGLAGRQHLDAGLRAGREPFVRTPELAPVHVYMGAMSGGRGMECGVRVLLTVKST